MPPPLVLLHGLARTRHSLWPVAHAAEARGRRVVSIGYPSRRAAIEALAALVAARIAESVPEPAFDVVTHSMGGIVLRAMVARGLLPAARVHRVVMLAPPSRGSELAEAMRGWRLYRHLLGPAGQQLGTGADSAPLALPPLPFECGVIAGRRTLVPLAGHVFGGPSDGRVSVARAGADGMADFLVVDRAHPFLMWYPDVLAAIFGFLETGAFPR
ncbi:MAG: alpha/beta fold hydrolase [Gemmatirosa sp.]|nr:alpha/beta fold hydrolase [Gemmatirosa sp.]